MSDATDSLAAVGATVDPRTWRRVAWRIIPLIGAAYVMSYVDRANLGYVAEPMSRDVGLTSAQLGLAAGLFFIGYVLVEVPSNLMLRRFGARKWITRILLSWGAVTAATAAVNSPFALYTARVLLGFAEAGLGAGILFYLTLWFPRRHQAWALTGFFLMIPLSSIVGSPLAAGLLTWGERLLGMTGWRALFVIEGALTVLIGILIFTLLPDGPRDARWLSERDRLAVEHVLEAEADERRAHGALTGIAQALRSGRVWALAVVFFAIVFGLYPLAFFLPSMVATISAHVSTADSALLAGIPSAAAIVAMIAWVPVAGRMGPVRATAVPMAVGALGLLCATFAHGGLFIVAVCISAAGIYTAMSQFFRLPAIGLAGAAAASGIAVINSVSNLSGFAGPYITGAVKTATGSFTYALLTIALIMTGGLVILCTTGRYLSRIGGQSA
ncbi:MFS transporter [Streptomyces tubercidicus]|uniref:MFS transporter n=1 Tax=Streptomyces tubercidicus TaxID=47759 RepID=UPI0036C9494C